MSTTTLPKVTVIKDQLEFGKSQPVTLANLIAKLAKGTVLSVSDTDLSKIGAANQWLKVVDSQNRTGYVNGAGVSTSPEVQTGVPGYQFIDLSDQPMTAAPTLPTSTDPRFLDLSNNTLGAEVIDDEPLV